MNQAAVFQTNCKEQSFNYYFPKKLGETLHFMGQLHAHKSHTVQSFFFPSLKQAQKIYSPE